MDFNINNYISNLSYINKDFNSIWEEILEVVPKLTNKWRPGEANESDPLVVLLKELGIVSDKVNYNTDKNVLELFPDLVTQLRTAYSVFKSMGYNPNWYRSATTGITITYNGGISDANSTELDSSRRGQNYSLKLFTQVSDSDSTNIYTLLQKVDFVTGTPAQKLVPAIQGTINDFVINGNTLITIDNLDSQNRLYFVQPNVAQNGIFISFDPTFANYSVELGTGNTVANSESEDTAVWKRVDNIYQYLPGSYVYKFGIDPSNGSNYIQFPDDIGTLIGEGIYIKYILSDGANGNINRNAISVLVEDPETQNNITLSKDNFTITNGSATQNGADPESIEEMQQNYERVVGTFNTLVTLRDYNNYIYNATDQVDQHVVSNIKVSDRTNDLYTHIKYKMMDNAGGIHNNNVQVSVDSNINPTATYPNLTPYDLRLYPTQPVENINNYTDYSTTFNCVKAGENNTSTVYETTDNWITNITNSIDDVKSINHNYKRYCGAPIFLNYEIEGQIYLQKSVSASEATEIKQNVDTAIYRNFNARQLYFGEKINYTKLVDVVKNADPRIQYVAINPINYEVDDASVTLFNSMTDFSGNKAEVTAGEKTVVYPAYKFDITTRSILSGATPFLITEDESTGERQNGIYPFMIEWVKDGALKLYPEGEDKLIKSINPIITKEAGGGSSIQVQPNETLSILVPEYRTTTTYGNFAYAELSNDFAGSLVKGTPYELKDGQTINFYDLGTNGNHLGEIKSHTIVTFDSTDSNIPDLGLVTKSGNRYSLGAKNTISVVERDEAKIKNTYLDLNNENIDADAPNSTYQVKIASNSKSLYDYLTANPPTSDNGYTLNIGEYLLYADYTADGVTLEVGIIGEGNTLTILEGKALFEANNANEKAFLIPTTSNLNNPDSFISQSFISIPSNVLKYSINTILSFGEGTTVTLEGGAFPNDNDFEGVKTLSSSIKSITYVTKDSTKETITGKQANDSYKLSYALALQIGPNSSQKLGKNQQVKITYNKGEPSTITGEAIQSSSVVFYAGGGTPLELDEDEAEGLVILATPTAYSRNNYFEGTSDNTAPTGNKYIYAYKKSKGENAASYFVQYQIINGGSSREAGVEAGPLFLIKNNAKYYNGTDWATPINPAELTEKSTPSIFYNPIMSGDNPGISENCYCPLYFPDTNEQILDPMSPDAFFKTSHPCNAYVLPKLKSNKALQKLTISPLSIKG